MTQHLESMNIGDKLSIEGPRGRLAYFGDGNFVIDKKEKKKTRIGMIAGGTGITPQYQILQAATKNSDKCSYSIIYANKTEEDILLREELENFHKENPKFNLFYTVDKPKDDWKQGKGFVSKEMLSEHMPQPGPDTLILLCGPLPMCEITEKVLTKDLGYTRDMIFRF